ncbi:bifunctional 4-hydroxy-4-methyl-2-oxoglutarate aldolase/oxaloacetate decarboxylase [Sporobolomyces koalae]|uniref:bifunctional 4-hydroxy-4-methyl-2-oxoglutarate aldolase/oxaloacetate decarboxylase n=1 Tax=Sporobolomyces koalae TaxID=500713 RepID=UPI0031766AF0
MPHARATAVQLDALSNLSTCEISDALVKLGHPTGGLVPDLERFSGDADQTVIGEAFTVEMVQGDNTEAPKLEDHFIDLVTPGSVLFISSPSHVKSASLGGLLATALDRKQVKGVMISGRCRDLKELRQLGLPVYARGHSTLGQSPFTRPSRVQIPLTIDPDASTASGSESRFPPTDVHPFDVVVADIDGVVVIRPEKIDSVLELAKIGREVDEKCRHDLEAGQGVKVTFALHRGTKSK